jgi:hypothetical protein
VVVIVGATGAVMTALLYRSLHVEPLDIHDAFVAASGGRKPSWKCSGVFCLGEKGRVTYGVDCEVVDRDWLAGDGTG